MIEVLSKEEKISGNEGWWTGKVGIFPPILFLLFVSTFPASPRTSFNFIRLTYLGTNSSSKKNLEMAVKAVSAVGAWRGVIRFPNCHKCHFQ